MEICKVPTLRLKALNNHTNIMYIEMENAIPPQKKEGGREEGGTFDLRLFNQAKEMFGLTHLRDTWN